MRIVEVLGDGTGVSCTWSPGQPLRHRKVSGAARHLLGQLDAWDPEGPVWDAVRLLVRLEMGFYRHRRPAPADVRLEPDPYHHGPQVAPRAWT